MPDAILYGIAWVVISAIVIGFVHEGTKETNKMPTFEHDCDGCVFLGTKEHNGRTFDLYECVASYSGRLVTTYVARFSSDGPDYYSETPEYNLGGKRFNFSVMQALFT